MEKIAARSTISILVLLVGQFSSGQTQRRVLVPIQRRVPPTHTGIETPQIAVLAGPQMALLAGSEGSTVYLKWVVSSGWIPSGRGFQVYRELNGVRQGPLNSAPITYQDAANVKPLLHRRSLTKSTVPPQIAVALSAHISDLIATARTTVPGKTDAQVFSLKPSTLPRLTSAAVFGAIQTGIQAVALKRPAMTPPSSYINQGLSQPMVAQRLGDFHKSAVMVAKARFAILAAPSVEEKVRSARMALHVGILARDEVAAAAGSEFQDTQASPGATYTYVLTFMNATGQETEMARKALTVGQDPVPIPPKTVRVTQTGTNEVALDWDAGDETLLASLGLDTYNVYRIDPAHPQGVLITPNPVAKPVEKSSDGKSLLENWYTFLDRSAPVGAVTYQVRMVDGLGRESTTSSAAQVSVQDWATPVAPTKVTAAIAFDQAVTQGAANRETVSFQVPPDPAASYHIYRVDAESKTAQPTLVKDLAPTDGSNTPPGSGQGAGKTPTTYFRATDQNLPEDHHFKYLVTAFYPRNKFESIPAASDAVGVPTLAAPVAPANFLAQLSPNVPVLKFTPPVYVNPRLRQILGNPLVTPVYGSSVDLKWTESTALGAPFTYKVYRMDMTPAAATPVRRIVPFRARRESKESLKESLRDTLKKTPTATPSHGTLTLLKPEIPKVVAPRTKLASHQSMVRSPAMAKVLAARFAGTASTTIMTAEVAANQCADGIVPTQSGEDFSYYVVPVNRWGMEGPPSPPAAVHIKPTLPPGPPHLALVMDNPENRTQIIVQIATSPEAQEVTTYRVFRADLGFHIFQYFNPTRVLPPKKGVVRTKPIKRGAPINVDNDQDGANVPPSSVATYSPPSPEVDANFIELPKGSFTESHTEDGLVTLVDNTCTPTKDYAYKVVAVNSSGLNSDRSAYLIGTSLPTAAPPPSFYSPTMDGTGITIQYQVNPEMILYKSASGATISTFELGQGRIILERALASSSNWVVLDAKEASGVGTVKDQTPIEGQTYKYRLRAVDKLGNISPPSPELSVTYNPG